MSGYVVPDVFTLQGMMGVPPASQRVRGSVDSRLGVLRSGRVWLARLRRSLVSGLSHRRLPLGLALVAVALALPSLDGGWQFDDLYHRAILLGRTDLSPWAMFSVFRGGPVWRRLFVDSGQGPWWTAEDFRVAFFRFLTVATHRLDYALWPDAPTLMHAQSLVWYGLLVAAATSLYRRVLGAGWVAGLAALAYAVDDGHAFAAAWIANRNALLATFFGLLCVWAHDRWRRDSWRPGGWLAPLALAHALAAGELGASTLAYLAAHALFLDSAPWRRRLVALVPSGVVAALWVCVYRMFGFGVIGSGLYIDPGNDPGGFVAALVRRAPFSLLGQWTAVPADAGGILAPLFPPDMWLYALGFVVVLVLLLAPLLWHDAAARFLATGMFLSIVPISGTLPANRQLLFVGFGAMGLFAQLVQGALAGASWVPSSRAWRYAARVFVAMLLPVHLILAPLSTPLQMSSVKAIGAPIGPAIASLPADPALAGQDLIVVNAPEYLFFVGAVLPLHQLAGQPLPRHVRALASGLSAVDVTRRDAETLEVHLERGLFFGAIASFFRSARHPLSPGDVVSLTGLTVTILETGPDGSPTRILYRFDRPLDDVGLRWVRWQDGVYVPFTPPAPGMTVHLEPAVGPFERIGGWSNDGAEDTP
jgi:hypothetical protein